jgi:hypothetical protein
VCQRRAGRATVTIECAADLLVEVRLERSRQS